MTPEASTVTLAGGSRLSYGDRGESFGPALVMLPGPTDSWRSYTEVLERLPSSIHAIAVSQRGHGDSDKPAHGYRVEDFAGDVVVLLDALDIERAVVAGHSGSCLVARRVAIDSPERVGGLVLEASPATLRGDAGLEGFVESLTNLQDPVEPSFVRSFVTGTSSDDLAPDLCDMLVDETRKVPARVWREMFEWLLRYDDIAELEWITAPTLMIWGDADALVGRDVQARLEERIPGAELLVYRGVGHTPRWEDPSRFASDVAAFVERSTATQT
jgi:non-heme chloroperoxidase